MDQYRPVEQQPTPEKNEIRITDQENIWSFHSQATFMLEKKGSDTIVLKAMGSAISQGVMVAESVKSKIAGLHQNTLIGSTDISYIWEGPEGSLSQLETTHHVPMITITLSRKELDTSSSGYQSPIPAGQINPSRELSYEGELLPSGSGRWNDVHGGCDSRGRDKGNVNEVPDDNANRGWDARHGYAGRGRGRGRHQAFQGQGRGYNGEIFGIYDNESRHQESGNINGVPNLSINGSSDARPGYADRERGRDQAFQGQVRGHGGEIGAVNERENMHQESGNINRVADLSVSGGSDARPGFAGRERGRGRYQTFQGRGYSGETDGGYGDMNGVPDLSSNGASHARPGYAVRGQGRGRNQTFQGRGKGYSGETGFGFGRGNMHQESGAINGVPDLSINVDLDARPGYAERGRGRGRDQTFQGRGRGYSGEVGGGYGRGHMHEESGNINGVPDSVNGGSHARPGYAVRGRGRNHSFQGRGRGYSGETGFGYGRGNMHQESGDINGVPDLSINGGLDARPAYAGRGSGQGRDQTFQGRGSGYRGEVGGGFGRGNMHEESGNINGVPDLCVNGGRDARHGCAERGRGRGRDQTFQGRGRGYSCEIGGTHVRENMHEESGNVNGSPDLSVNGDWDARRGYDGSKISSLTGNIREVLPANQSINGAWGARNGYAWRGRGRGRGRVHQGRGRGYSGEGGGCNSRETMHQESGNTNGMPDLTINRVLNDTHGYVGRGRGRGRTRDFHGRDGGCGGGFVGGSGNGSMHQEPSLSEEFNGSEASTQEKDVGSSEQNDDSTEQHQHLDNMESEQKDTSAELYQHLDDMESEQNDDSAEQHQHLDNMETPLDVRQLPPTNDNLPLGSVYLAFDDLSDADITRIGSACGFVFPGNSTQAVALIRLLEKQRAKVCAT